MLIGRLPTCELPSAKASADFLILILPSLDLIKMFPAFASAPFAKPLFKSDGAE